jgi:hypothetical protein
MALNGRHDTVIRKVHQKGTFHIPPFLAGPAEGLKIPRMSEKLGSGSTAAVLAIRQGP